MHDARLGVAGHERVDRGASPIRIATVYLRNSFDRLTPHTMATTRWLRMSESLARQGFTVDMIVNLRAGIVEAGPNLRLVPFASVRWSDYHVVKTLFHRGFDALTDEGGAGHPFIISKLGSVVASRDADGVHFVGDERAALWDTQERLQRTSRYVTVLTEPSRRLWETEFGANRNLLHVPTGVDERIPPPARNPYEGIDEPVAVYIGNLYSGHQKPVNLHWQMRLNELGRSLATRGIRLCVVGPGEVEQLDPRAVTYMGAVENSQVWDYHYFARVGVVLAQGEIQHNESSKIYYYLRAGLPVVSEAPVPNNHLIEESGLGFVTPFGDTAWMTEMIADAAERTWPREDAIAWMLAHHTWDHRAALYERLIRTECPA